MFLVILLVILLMITKLPRVVLTGIINDLPLQAVRNETAVPVGLPRHRVVGAPVNDTPTAHFLLLIPPETLAVDKGQVPLTPPALYPIQTRSPFYVLSRLAILHRQMQQRNPCFLPASINNR